MRPTFVIGDVHGNLDRLEALLAKAGVDDKDCLVVQLGDLGHFGPHTGMHDLETWKRAEEGWVDVVLWGNHDRAVVDRHHVFGGYAPPFPETFEVMKKMRDQGRLKLALESHGWLITHAGLHLAFKYAKEVSQDAAVVAEWLCELESVQPDRRGISIVRGPRRFIDGISPLRGGGASEGGILWRDVREKLYDGMPQVFGHSADRHRLVRGEEDRWWCVDVGGKPSVNDPDADCLAGIWLPSQEIVRVDHAEVKHESIESARRATISDT